MLDSNQPTNWQKDWPSSNEEELLLRYVALLRKEELEQELSELAPDQPPLETTELDAKIAQMIRQGQRQRAKHRRRSRWRKVLAVALITVVTLLAIPTVLFALSPEFRETVYTYILEWGEGHVRISTGAEGEDDAELHYAPTYLPEGFELTNIEDSLAAFCLDYYKDEHFIFVETSNMSKGSTVDTDTTDYLFDHKINGYPCIIGQDGDDVSIFWNDGHREFSIRTNLGLQTAIKIAQSIELQENYL